MKEVIVILLICVMPVACLAGHEVISQGNLQQVLLGPEKGMVSVVTYPVPKGGMFAQNQISPYKGHSDRRRIRSFHYGAVNTSVFTVKLKEITQMIVDENGVSREEVLDQNKEDIRVSLSGLSPKTGEFEIQGIPVRITVDINNNVTAKIL